MVPPAKIVRVCVLRMWESCQRTTFFVELTTDEGFTITPSSHQTGSAYTDFKGLSVDEARDRALSDASDWADFLRLEADPYVEDGVTYLPSRIMQPYTTQRILAQRDAAEKTTLPS